MKVEAEKYETKIVTILHVLVEYQEMVTTGMTEMEL